MTAASDLRAILLRGWREGWWGPEEQRAFDAAIGPAAECVLRFLEVFYRESGKR